MGKRPWENYVSCHPPLPLVLTHYLGSHTQSMNCSQSFFKKISVKSNCSFPLMPNAVPFCLYLFQITFKCLQKDLYIGNILLVADLQ